MQVTHVQDHVTHAVIGGASTIAFGVSDDPALMHVLSTALYKDQILAVVRETLCNAWDAHIEAGCTDRAVRVTLADGKLIIRDFGKGIPPELIGPLYCTYGGTNKKNDGNQTGGFGLGCKAPFAYGDHFEVQSFHAGVRTIYALSKSSGERQGKPGATPIASFPTTETGVQVTITIKGGDHLRFSTLLQRIIMNGEMNAEINGSRPKHLPLSFAPHGWILTTVRPLDEPCLICVRYGNVVYPVDHAPGLGPAYRAVQEFVQKLGDGGSSRYTIILQAPPHSISVQPSREGLSMQAHTVETIKALLEAFLPLTEKPLAQECFHLLDGAIREVKTKRQIGELLTAKRAMPGRSQQTWSVNQDNLPVITNLTVMAAQKTRRHYPQLPGFRERDMSQRIEAAIELGAGDRGHLQEIRRLIQGPTSKSEIQTAWTKGKSTFEHRVLNERHSPAAWYRRRIVRPLARDLQIEKLRPKNMLVFSRSVSRGSDYLVDFDKYDRPHHETYLPILRKIVVLTSSRKDLGARVSGFPEWKLLGEPDEFFVYVVPAAAKKAQEQAREFFKKRGYNLLDLTVRHPWMAELDEKPKPTVPINRKPRLAGFPSLAGAKTRKIQYREYRLDYALQDDAPRITKPALYLRFLPSRADERRWCVWRFEEHVATTAFKLFGDSCALVHTDAMEKKMEAEGIPNFQDYVLPLVISRVTTAPQFLKYWTESMEIATGGVAGEVHYDRLNLIPLLDVPEVRAAVGLHNFLNDEDLMILALWRAISADSSFDRDIVPSCVGRAAARDTIKKIPLTQAAAELGKAIVSSPLLKVIDLKELRTALRRTDATNKGLPDRVARLMKTVLVG